MYSVHTYLYPFAELLFVYFRFRCLIHWIVTKKVFDMFIMFVIVLSSIALASEDPVNEESPRNVFLGKADYAFTAIFTMECTLKVRLFYNIPVSDGLGCQKSGSGRVRELFGGFRVFKK